MRSSITGLLDQPRVDSAFFMGPMLPETGGALGFERLGRLT